MNFLFSYIPLRLDVPAFPEETGIVKVPETSDNMAIIAAAAAVTLLAAAAVAGIIFLVRKKEEKNGSKA